jgi:hypothetical protein
LLGANAHVGIEAVAPGDSITVKLLIADTGTTAQLVNHADHVTYAEGGQVGRCDFGSPATTRSYESSMSSRASASVGQPRPCRVTAFQSCLLR